MVNRRLSRRALAYASGRAESTINRLVTGATAPSVELLQDIAPTLQLSVADLLVIAGLQTDPVAHRPGPYAASSEIGSLVAAASWLSPEQVEQVTALARRLKATNT
jgi:transcriptional regulator with XRE-family HTH domain